MPLHVLGINHQSSPLDIREKLAFPPEAQGAALADLAAQPGVAEAVLVSTCNRTEVYCRADDLAAARAWLVRAGQRAGVEIDPLLYSHSEDAAIRHAFRVASGTTTEALGRLSISISAVLLLMYLLYLVFALMTHSSLFAGSYAADEGNARASAWSVRTAAFVLAATTALIAWMSEILVNSD